MRDDTKRSYEERILRALVRIQERLDEPLSLEELAGVACFSPYHFHRIFRGMVGESVMAHVRRLRLERAARRLKATRQPVTEIARAAGYDALEAFSRAFRDRFGESPSGFRKSRRDPAAPHAPSTVHPELWEASRAFWPTPSLGALPVRIEELPPRRVVFLRHVGPYDQVGRTWRELFTWAGRRGWMGSDTAWLGIVHDDPEITSPEKIRYDACITVDGRVRGEGRFGVQTLPGGLYAAGSHRGPYEGLAEAYAWFCGMWLPRSGRELRPIPPVEVYRNSPWRTAPEDLVTEIYLPLEDDDGE